MPPLLLPLLLLLTTPLSTSFTLPPSTPEASASVWKGPFLSDLPAHHLGCSVALSSLSPSTPSPAIIFFSYPTSLNTTASLSTVTTPGADAEARAQAHFATGAASLRVSTLDLRTSAVYESLPHTTRDVALDSAYPRPRQYCSAAVVRTTSPRVQGLDSPPPSSDSRHVALFGGRVNGKWLDELVFLDLEQWAWWWPKQEHGPPALVQPGSTADASGSRLLVFAEAPSLYSLSLTTRSWTVHTPPNSPSRHVSSTSISASLWLVASPTALHTLNTDTLTWTTVRPIDPLPPLAMCYSPAINAAVLLSSSSTSVVPLSSAAAPSSSVPHATPPGTLAHTISDSTCLALSLPDQSASYFDVQTHAWHNLSTNPTPTLSLPDTSTAAVIDDASMGILTPSAFIIVSATTPATVERFARPPPAASTTPCMITIPSKSAVLIYASTLSWFSLTTHAFEPVQPTNADLLPTTASGASMVLLPSRSHAVIFGGMADYTLTLYNVATNTLTQRAASFSGVSVSTVARHRHVAAMLPDGRMIVFGGLHDTPTGQVALNDVLQLDTKTWTWAPYPALGRAPPARDRFVGTMSGDGTVLLVAGVGDPDFFVHILVTTIGQWQELRVSSDPSAEADAQVDGFVVAAWLHNFVMLAYPTTSKPFALGRLFPGTLSVGVAQEGEVGHDGACTATRGGYGCRTIHAAVSTVCTPRLGDKSSWLSSFPTVVVFGSVSVQRTVSLSCPVAVVGPPTSPLSKIVCAVDNCHCFASSSSYEIGDLQTSTFVAMNLRFFDLEITSAPHPTQSRRFLAVGNLISVTTRLELRHVYVHDFVVRNDSAIKCEVPISRTLSGLGGIVTALNAQVGVVNARFEDCSGAAAGAALGMGATSLFVTNSTFRRNQALARGGALSCVVCDMHVLESRFEHNRAIIGGVMWGLHVRWSSAENVYSYNEVRRLTPDSGGGQAGVLFFDESFGAVANETFSYNRADFGGAIGTLSSDLTITGANFLENQANLHGGALQVGGGLFKISHSQWTRNRAIAGGGGAVFMNNPLIGGDAFQFDNATNVRSENRAEFGDDFATDRTHLVLDVADVASADSGHELDEVVCVSCRDWFDRVFSSDNTSFVTVNAVSPGVGLLGQVIRQVQFGRVCFHDLRVFSDPGSMVRLNFTSAACGTPTSIQVNVRPCRAGQMVAARAGGSVCEDCPAGSWSNAVNADHCEPCAEHHFASEPGSKQCEPCPINEFQPARGADTCIPCSDGQYFNAHKQQCLTCPEGVDCYGGLINAQKGYYVIRDRSSGTLVSNQCATESQCRAGATCRNNSEPHGKVSTCCGEHRREASHNPICAKCEEGFYEWGGSCIECDSANVPIILAVLLAGWVYVVIVHRLAQSSSGIVPVLLYFLQMTSVMLGPNGRRRTWAAVVGFFSLTPREPSGAACIAPIDPLPKFLFGIAFPAICFGLLLLTYLLSVAYEKFEARKRHRPGRYRPPSDSVIADDIPVRPVRSREAAYIRSAHALLITSFNVVTSTVFAFFNCVDVGDGTSVISAAPAVQCHSREWNSVLPIMVVLLVIFVVGLPTYILALLMYLRNHFLLRSEEHLSRFGILYEQHGLDRWWWVIVVLLRRSAIISVIVFSKSLGTAFTIVAGLNLVFLLLQILVSPFRRAVDNMIEAALLTLLTFVSIVLIDAGQPLSVSTSNGIAVIVLVPTIITLSYAFAKTKLFARLNPFSKRAFETDELDEWSEATNMYTDDHFADSGSLANGLRMRELSSSLLQGSIDESGESEMADESSSEEE